MALDWKAAAAVVESRQSSRDTELLEASRVLLAKVRTLTRRKHRMITVGDVTLTIDAWAERSGILAQAIYARLRKGWPESDAVTLPNQAGGSKFGGKTLQQHSDATGIPKSCIYARLERKWPLEQAITQPVDVRARKRKR